MPESSSIKQQIITHAQSLGADLVRSCDVQKWEEIPIQDPEFWPQNIWPWARHVLVMGIPLFAPMLSTTPSMVYQELYDTTNRVLDNLAYSVTKYIVNLGYKAIFFPRDCYFDIHVLLDNPNAAFSHVLAAYYAGMGTIGDSHNLITKEYGPRLRIVSILTDAPLEPDPMLEHNLCIHCGKCLRLCPSQCFRDAGGPVYEMDKIKCTQYHCDLVDQHHWPCGVCVSVCPVGDDIKRYRGQPLVTEEGIRHCRIFGS